MSSASSELQPRYERGEKREPGDVAPLREREVVDDLLRILAVGDVLNIEVEAELAEIEGEAPLDADVGLEERRNSDRVLRPEDRLIDVIASIEERVHHR